MASIDQRYASAIRSSNLGVDDKTTRSDSDVLGAMGLADRTLTRGHDGRGNHSFRCPLAVPLTRLLAGDNNASREVVKILSVMAHKHSFVLDVRVNRTDCHEMALACLAWYRHGACKACGGHGKLVIPGTTTLGAQDCDACRGRGKMVFESAFPADWHVLANWLACEMERALGRAGPAAMAHLAPKLEL